MPKKLTQLMKLSKTYAIKRKPRKSRQLPQLMQQKTCQADSHPIDIEQLAQFVRVYPSQDVLVSPKSSLFPLLCFPGADKGDQGKEQIPAEGKREEGKKPERR